MKRMITGLCLVPIGMIVFVITGKLLFSSIILVLVITIQMHYLLTYKQIDNRKN